MVTLRNSARDKNSYAAALTAMNEAKFNLAARQLEVLVARDRANAKAYYTLAVAYIRGTPPVLDKALACRDKAAGLGYTIPDWFDNYYRILTAKKK